MLLTAQFFSGCTESNDENIAAIVNGEEITKDEVKELQKSYTQFGQQMSEEDALEELIDQKLLKQQSRKDKYNATDEEAELELEIMLEQYGMNLEIFKQQLREEGESYEKYLEDFKESIAIQNYLEDVFGKDTTLIEEGEIESLVQSLRDEADIKYL